MVKSYLKYEQSAHFGVVATSTSNSIWTPPATNSTRTTGAGQAYVPANEEILAWEIKTGELLSRWRDPDCRSPVTALARSAADPDIFAAGYTDGSIRLWDARTSTVVIRFEGHRSAVTQLAFEKEGVRLASGSRDTDVIVWDLVAEAGLFKLRGHKGEITGLAFFRPSEPTAAGENGDKADGELDEIAPPRPSTTTSYLLSTSKDALIKIWDVEAQYCVETHVTQANGECWALAVSPEESGCITAGNDGEIKVWSIDGDCLAKISQYIDGNDKGQAVLRERGVLYRHGRERTIGISFHPKADYIAVHGAEKAVEIWRIRAPDEVKRSVARKRRRKREKAIAEGQVVSENDTKRDENAEEPHITDVFVPYVIVRTGGKVRSLQWANTKSLKQLQLLISTTNNQLELYQVPIQNASKSSQESSEYSRSLAVDLPGHRTDIRALALSSDDKMLASASSGSLKIWNLQTQSCLRTIDCGYSLCCAFLPGDKIVIVGTKEGKLELFDVASSSLIDTVDAHEGSVWTLRVHPDGRSVVTGGADKTAKFWRFEVVNEEIPGTRRTTQRLKLVHTRTLKVNDDVLNTCFSPDARLLAVATLDNTVKVFFCDTLKLFLTLFGHKLPVLNMSISSDSKLIATCSADKNVRLWGLDFGDCHKAFFAHDESIMQVGFVPQPAEKEDVHLFFSASKDHVLKSWDGDKFQQVQKLSGHQGEIWAMAIGRTGDFVVTASHDKSIRVWSQTDEPLFLEEERERELEELYDTNLTTTLEKDQADEYALAEEAGDNAEVVPASKQTSSTLTAGEKITEALTLCTEDLEIMREYNDQRAQTSSAAPPQRHPLLAMRNVSAEAHLLSVFEAIPAAALDDALLLLSFSVLPQLFTFLSMWLEREMNVTLTCRVLFFLLKTHHRQIVASRELRAVLLEIRGRLRTSLGGWKELMGFNLAATKILAARIGESKIRTVEDVDQGKSNVASKKRAFVNVA